MKKILITGQNSYIGNKFEEWVSQWPDEYQVTKISVRKDDWKNQNWGIYDVVLNVAGIAHKRITKENESDYYKVNRDLAIDIANKAKNDGVNHFIQISTMSVFGIDKGTIDNNTPRIPINAYGKSKLLADEYINKLNNNYFTVSIIRPPMVYGPKSPGNYARLSSISKKSPIFPQISNKRSMIYINNLSNLIKKIIERKIPGIFHPQNSDYVNTSELVKEIRKTSNKKVLLIDMSFILDPFIKKIDILNKVFGDLIYDQRISDLSLEYNVTDLKKSVIETEMR